MSAKGEIGWRRTSEDGMEFHVYARRIGTIWHFYERQRRYDSWQEIVAPPLTDWLELLDAVQRRVQRRLLPPTEKERVRQRIRQLFPDAVLEA